MLAAFVEMSSLRVADWPEDRICPKIGYLVGLLAVEEDGLFANLLSMKGAFFIRYSEAWADDVLAEMEACVGRWTWLGGGAVFGVFGR